MGRGSILKRSRSSFPHLPLCKWAHSVLSNISTSYPHLQGRSPTRYSPVRHSRGEQALPYRSTCMLKTRRQRSFWARIKLSIILFQIPRRASDLFNNLKQVPFLTFLGTLTLRKKKNTRKKAIPSCAFLFSLILYSTLIHPYQKLYALAIFVLSLPS